MTMMLTATTMNVPSRCTITVTERLQPLFGLLSLLPLLLLLPTYCYGNSYRCCDCYCYCCYIGPAHSCHFYYENSCIFQLRLLLLRLLPLPLQLLLLWMLLLFLLLLLLLLLRLLLLRFGILHQLSLSLLLHLLTTIASTGMSFERVDSTSQVYGSLVHLCFLVERFAIAATARSCVVLRTAVEEAA